MSDVTCGTHVHVSPGDSEWTLEQVKNVSRSVLYFEEAFEVLLPPERRGNPECRSNRSDNQQLKDLPDLEACFQSIHQCTTIKAVVHLMNAKEGDHSPVDEEPNGEKTLTERRYGFNFENLMEGKIGTIGKCQDCGSFTVDLTYSVEFRRPPCVTNYQDCVMWAEFGASFMQAAMQYGTSPTHLRTFGPDVAGLAAFMGKATVQGVNDPRILDKLFTRGSGCLPVRPLKYDHYY